MTNKPTINKPEWATTEAIGPNVIEPTAHKTTGFIQQSGIPEKPSYQELNYLFKSTYEWFEYLETITDEAKEYIIPCGEDLAAGDIIRISGGQAFKADNTTEAGITAVAGVNVNAVTSGNNATIAYGYYDAFSSLTVGTTYYVGVSGGITSTLPATYQVRLGVAVSTTRINLDIKNDVTNYIPYYDVKHFYPRADAVTIGSAYTYVYYHENGSEQAWINNLSIQNKVKVLFRFTGAASSPSVMQVKLRKFISGSWVDQFESNQFNVSNPGTFEYNDFVFDLHTGNSLNYDIYTTPFPGVNEQGGNSAVMALGSGTTPRLHQISFYWMK